MTTRPSLVIPTARNLASAWEGGGPPSPEPRYLRTECISGKMSDVTDSALGDLATALNDLYRLSGSARFHEQTVSVTGVAVSRSGLHFLSLVADTGPVS